MGVLRGCAQRVPGVVVGVGRLDVGGECGAEHLLAGNDRLQRDARVVEHRHRRPSFQAVGGAVDVEGSGVRPDCRSPVPDRQSPNSTRHRAPTQARNRKRWPWAWCARHSPPTTTGCATCEPSMVSAPTPWTHCRASTNSRSLLAARVWQVAVCRRGHFVSGRPLCGTLSLRSVGPGRLHLLRSVICQAKGTWAAGAALFSNGCCHRPSAASLGSTPSPNQYASSRCG